MRTGTTMALLALLLSACGGGFRGTFEDELGMSALTFHPDGRVVMSSPVAGVERELTYEIDGDRIRVRLSKDNDGAAAHPGRRRHPVRTGGTRYRRKD